MLSEDTVRTVNRWTALIIMPVLFTAGIILALNATRTRALWGWEIKVTMNSITMGSGYLGGVWFFGRLARDPRPEAAAGGLAAAALFVTGLGVATVIHWETFNYDHVAFWAWSFLYFFTPFFLPWLFWQNWRHRAPDDSPVLPRWGVIGMLLVGITQLLAAVTWYTQPHLALDNWPWKSTALSMRSLSSFVAFSGAMMIWVVIDRRWIALRNGVEALSLGLTVTTIGALISIDDFEGGGGHSVGIGLYIGALAYLAVLFGALMLYMAPKMRLWERRRAQERTVPIGEGPAATPAG